jgi:hypothetical protein
MDSSPRTEQHLHHLRVSTPSCPVQGSLADLQCCTNESVAASGPGGCGRLMGTEAAAAQAQRVFCCNVYSGMCCCNCRAGPHQYGSAPSAGKVGPRRPEMSLLQHLLTTWKTYLLPSKATPAKQTSQQATEV